MQITNPIFAVIVLLVGFVTAWVLCKRFGVPKPAGQYVGVEGLRGFLAICVVVHHACIWFFYMRSGVWQVPPSNLFTHLGQSSVAMFFMITAFLFFSKLIDGQQKPIDWVRLYVSRFLRLVPLYLLIIFLMLLTVGHLSGWVLHLPTSTVLRQVSSWLFFVFHGSPDINKVPYTSIIGAGVVWSLPYEWLFYAALPLFALLFNRTKQNIFWALASVLVVWFLISQFFAFDHTKLYPFIGGVVASFVVRLPALRFWSQQAVASVVAVVSLLSAVYFYPTAYTNEALVLLSVTFIIIACGNTIFGFLELPASRWLGQIGYGIYLLHGFVLFWVIGMVIGPIAQWLSPAQHWSIICACMVVVVCLASLAYAFVEAPAMSKVNKLREWLGRFGI